jgi:hypothetical protein
MAGQRELPVSICALAAIRHTELPRARALLSDRHNSGARKNGRIACRSLHHRSDAARSPVNGAGQGLGCQSAEGATRSAISTFSALARLPSIEIEGFAVPSSMALTSACLVSAAAARSRWLHPLAVRSSSRFAANARWQFFRARVWERSTIVNDQTLRWEDC